MIRTIHVLCFMLLVPLCMRGQEHEALVHWTAQSQSENDSVGATAATPQNTFRIGVNLQARGEIRDGGFPRDPEASKPTDMSLFVNSRARLTLEYERPHFAMRISAQHTGIWGQENRGAFNLHEAWAKVTSKQGLFLQIGRQALSYDDERIIGMNDWTMAANSHDALKLGYEGLGHKLHLIATYNQNANASTSGSTFFANGSQPHKTFQVVWYHYDAPWQTVPFGFSVLGMNIGMQGGEQGVNEHMEWQQLVGAYVQCCPKYCTFEASYYHQFGYTEQHAPINAFMASARAQVQPADLYGFTAGYDYLSGDDYLVLRGSSQMGLPRHEIIKGFNPIYGSHHKFYGMMDFFYISAYMDGFSPGLQNAYAGCFVNPIKGLHLSATYHYMAMTAHLKDREGTPIDQTLGHMAEIEISYNILKDFKIAGGFSYMGGSNTLQRLKQASSDGRLLWGWISLVATPVIFEGQWFDKKKK